jgi:PAS domain S-box-containing protein
VKLPSASLSSILIAISRDLGVTRWNPTAQKILGISSDIWEKNMILHKSGVEWNKVADQDIYLSLVWPMSIVLIVDDEPLVLESISAVLEGQGYQLIFAGSGPEALAKAAAHIPDVVLLDVMMPGMDGFEVCRRLRADPVLTEIPIIFVTALDDRESRLRGLEVGADDFLSKPLDRAEMRARLRNITQLHRYQSLLAERERYQHLTELSPDGVLVVASDGVIRYVNSTAVALLGDNSGDALPGRNLFDWIHPDNRETCKVFLDQLIQEKAHAAHLETNLLQKDGSLLPVDIRAGWITWEEQPMAQVLVRDITAQKRYEAELKALTETLQARGQELQELSQRLLEVQEAERRFLASELHDEVGQSLTALKLMLEIATSQQETDWRTRLDDAQGLLRELAERIRNLSLDLRPAMLDDFGLFAALEWLLGRFSKQTGIKIKYNFSYFDDRRFPRQVETAAFRIIQEALTNVARHASVNEAEVNIQVLKTLLQIKISDRGKGFDRSRFTQDVCHFGGLSGMRERANLAGGKLEIHSAPDRGTRITAEFSLGFSLSESDPEVSFDDESDNDPPGR